MHYDALQMPGGHPVSFRFADTTVAGLRDRARRSGTPQRELAERYILEGLRQEDHPQVYFRSGASGRRAALLGTRLGIADVISTFRQNGKSAEATAEYLDLSPAAVEAALRYYAEFTEEIDRELDEAAASAERERMLAERQAAALG